MIGVIVRHDVNDVGTAFRCFGRSNGETGEREEERGCEAKGR